MVWSDERRPPISPDRPVWDPISFEVSTSRRSLGSPPGTNTSDSFAVDMCDPSLAELLWRSFRPVCRACTDMADNSRLLWVPLSPPNGRRSLRAIGNPPSITSLTKRPRQRANCWTMGQCNRHDCRRRTYRDRRWFASNTGNNTVPMCSIPRPQGQTGWHNSLPPS